MKLLEKILVPVNLDNNNPQLEVAVDLAKRFNSQVMMIYVLPEEAKRESINHYVTRDINNSFEEILSGLDITNVNINKKIEYGNAADKIMLTAEVENVNLILFSNIIESPGSKFKVGVVAEKIIRKSQKPVWIIKEGSRVFPERILCSVDYSDASKRALNIN